MPWPQRYAIKQTKQLERLNMNMMEWAQIHRFSNRVALSFNGKGETIYLTAADAEAIGKQLIAASKDVMKRDFQNSEFKSFELKGA